MTTSPLTDAPPASASTPSPPDDRPIREVWWLACHGGAGSSTLAYLTGCGLDCGRHSPTRDFASHPDVGVVLVARVSNWGTLSAEHTLGTLGALAHPPRLLGLAAVAAEERRPARAVRERLELIESRVPELWHIPFVRELLAASDPSQVGLHPAIAALAAKLRAMVAEPEIGAPYGP